MDFEKKIALERLVFCENMRRLRNSKRLSKAQMAKELSIDVRTLNKLEAGIFPPRLTCSILFRILQKFDILPQDMLSKILRFPENDEG